MKGMVGMGSVLFVSVVMVVMYYVVGIVKNVDCKIGLVMFVYELVKILNWFVMMMGFCVEDLMLFDKLVFSKKVEFDFV